LVSGRVVQHQRGAAAADDVAPLAPYDEVWLADFCSTSSSRCNNWLVSVVVLGDESVLLLLSSLLVLSEADGVLQVEL
jgi:hypothetical protein